MEVWHRSSRGAKRECYLQRHVKRGISSEWHLSSYRSSPSYVAPETLAKVLRVLNRQLTFYHHLGISLGGPQDCEQLRSELSDLRRKARDMVVCCRAHLTESFKSADSLSKNDVEVLGWSCSMLVACVHMLDRELRLTHHLFKLFPLCPDPDYANNSQYIKTGASDGRTWRRLNITEFGDVDLGSMYYQERDHWNQLEEDILELHSMDVALHRDDVLGPVVDYLTLCPRVGGDDDFCPGTSFSIAHLSCSQPLMTEEITSRSRSKLFRCSVAILIVLLVAGGVLMGVALIIVEFQ